ncbi:MAG: hypothetical protein HUJ92_07785 [Bacteroidales bacterium]|nr:hypothetical protein [Bacteroidales bacterium]
MFNKLKLYSAAVLLTIGLASNAQNITRLRTDYQTNPIGIETEHPDRQNTQTSYVVPLYMDLFNEHNKPLAIEHLVKAIEKTDYTIKSGANGVSGRNLTNGRFRCELGSGNYEFIVRY